MAPLGTSVHQVNQNNPRSSRRIAKQKNTLLRSSKNSNQEESCKYKLTIRIDKIKSRPGPKSRKNALQLAARIKALAEINKMIDDYLPSGEEKIGASMKIHENVNNYPQENKPIIANVGKTNDFKNTEKPNERFSCSICRKSFTTEQKLSQHKQEVHFICHFCEIPCDNKLIRNAHEKLHLNSNKSFPFKCHFCVQVFKDKQLLKSHNRTVHPHILKVLESTGTNNFNNDKETIEESTDFQPMLTRSRKSAINSTSKPLSLSKELPGKNNLNNDKEKIEENTDLKQMVTRSRKTEMNSTPKSSKLSKNLAGNLSTRSSVNQEMSRQTAPSVINQNTTTPIPLKLLKNLSIIPTFKLCKLCGQYINFNEMARHIADHLSRAYPCLICNKLFIDSNSLLAHLKTHEAK